MKNEIHDEVFLLVCISSCMTVAARGTYETGTENVLKSSTLRAYNEAQHRITAAIRDRLMGKEFMPVKDVLEMLDNLGKAYAESGNIEFFLKDAFRVYEMKYPPAQT